MELLDALTGNTSARSVVELSLAPSFRRTYSSVYAAVGQCFAGTQAEQRRRGERTLLQLIALRLAQPERRKYWLFGIDATSVPRVFAPTLPDRGYVHCANPIGGNKPITLGHQYSLLAYLPDKLPDSTWGPPAQTAETTYTSRRGRVYKVQIQAWHDLLMRSTRKQAVHAELFTVVRVRLLHAEFVIGFILDRNNALH
jgi:hypothetical protein